MDASVVLAAVVGLLVGAGGVLALLAGDRARAGGAGGAGAGGTDDAIAALPPGLPDLLAVLGGPAVVLDDSDEVVRASPAAYALGLVRGRSLAHQGLLALVRSARRDGRTHERRLDFPRGPIAGSGRVVLEARAAPVGPQHVLLLANDHTEAARVEEMRRDFVVNVSHELKTPLGALSLLAEAVEGAADDPVAVRRFAGRISVETGRLTQLVRDIIDLSQLQGRGPTTDPAVVDVLECVAEAVDRSRLGAAAAGVTVEVAADGHDGEAIEVYGAADQLTTAVANLVDNAVRYSEAGTRVAVGVRRHDGLVEITVKDQGIGIPAAEQERVFERFYRVDPARSRATGGTGLGLSIVKHVMSQHGGDVHLWSQVGQGSTFTLRLPDQSAGRPERRATPRPARGAGPGRPSGAGTREGVEAGR